MTKREAENYAHLQRACTDSLGIERDDFVALLRIERTLHRWGERECNGEVEVDDATAKAYRIDSLWSQKPERWPIANKEAGALKRLARIMARYPKLGAYHQGDPRGCALYVYEKGRLDRGDVSSCYSSVGVALCY